MVVLVLVLELEQELVLEFLVLEEPLALVLELDVLLGLMVLECLEILLEVLEGYAVSVVSVVLKTGLLGLILFVLCFPKAVILLLVRLLILEGSPLPEGLRLLQS